MSKHTGAHPRMGAMDVCPFVPVSNVTMEECVQCAHKFGKKASKELGIPIYLYEVWIMMLHEFSYIHQRLLPQEITARLLRILGLANMRVLVRRSISLSGPLITDLQSFYQNTVQP